MQVIIVFFLAFQLYGADQGQKSAIEVFQEKCCMPLIVQAADAYWHNYNDMPDASLIPKEIADILVGSRPLFTVETIIQQIQFLERHNKREQLEKALQFLKNNIETVFLTPLVKWHDFQHGVLYDNDKCWEMRVCKDFFGYGLGEQGNEEIFPLYRAQREQWRKFGREFIGKPAKEGTALVTSVLLMILPAMYMVS